MRTRLSKAHFNRYQIVDEFVADVQLIFTNCAMFNPVSCVDAFLEGHLGRNLRHYSTVSEDCGRWHPSKNLGIDIF